MDNVVVVGMQWGDEGKGKIVDLLCPAFDAVVRYQGGHNAGHTVRFRDRHFSLHLIPSGILHPEMLCVLGNGMVVHPEAFLDELDQLDEAGVRSDGRLFVSNARPRPAALHAALDEAREKARGDGKIGTTSRGIGPAYESKVARCGLRMGDLFAPTSKSGCEERIARQVRDLGAAVEVATVYADTRRRIDEWKPRLEPYVADTEPLLNGWIDDGKRLLFEGAQGTLLDVDHGTYPFVTSSNSTAGGAATGTGVPPTAIDDVIGVLKAYTTRVGGGPFPTELARRDRRVHPQARQRVRHHHRPAAPLRLARLTGRPLRPPHQRRRRHRPHQARRPRLARRDPGLRRLSRRRRGAARLPGRPRGAVPGEARDRGRPRVAQLDAGPGRVRRAPPGGARLCRADRRAGGRHRGFDLDRSAARGDDPPPQQHALDSHASGRDSAPLTPRRSGQDQPSTKPATKRIALLIPMSGVWLG